MSLSSAWPRDASGRTKIDATGTSPDAGRHGELACLGHRQLLSVLLLVRLRDPVGDLAHARQLAAGRLPARPGRRFGRRGPAGEDDERADARAEDGGESDDRGSRSGAGTRTCGPGRFASARAEAGVRLGRSGPDHILGHASSLARSISGFFRPTPSRIRTRSSPKTSRCSTSSSAIFSTAALLRRTRL